jgi:primary-amine oxidase
MNVAVAPCEGLAITAARYQPAGGTERTVLTRATLAEVHVPYDNNAARFLDVTVDTSGLGASAITLAAAECDGTRNLSNKVCVENEDHGFRWKYSTSSEEMHGIAVFLASQLGQYTYINRWVFHEDGSIEPQVGLTGQLQIISNSAADAPQFGSALHAAGQTVQVGLNHMHNFYYRLDFDLGGASDDVVQRISYAPSSVGAGCANNACGRTTFTPLNTETRETWSPSSLTSWVVQDKTLLNADGRRIGYEIKPHYMGLWRGKNDGTEAWAQHDLFVTRYNGCERFAARNLAPYLTGCAATTPQNVSTMVNGESTDGQDVVVWFVNRHHHVTRDEDQTFMPLEWTSFHIEPRSWFQSNPSE